jgi:hypothetical protein
MKSTPRLLNQAKLKKRADATPANLRLTLSRAHGMTGMKIATAKRTQRRIAGNSPKGSLGIAAARKGHMRVAVRKEIVGMNQTMMMMMMMMMMLIDDNNDDNDDDNDDDNVDDNNDDEKK